MGQWYPTVLFDFLLPDNIFWKKVKTLALFLQILISMLQLLQQRLEMFELLFIPTSGHTAIAADVLCPYNNR